MGPCSLGGEDLEPLQLAPRAPVLCLPSRSRTKRQAAAVCSGCRHRPSPLLRLLQNCVVLCLLAEQGKDVVHQESFSKFIPIAQLIIL